MKSLWFNIFAFTVMAGATVAAEIKPFTATYQIERSGDAVGEATISLHPIGGGKWKYITESKAQVFLFAYRDTETSVVTWKGDNVIPQSFIREREYPTRLTRTEQQFDWATKIENGNKDEKKQWKLLLEDDVQERHSHTLMLRRDLRAGATTMQYRISDGGKLRYYKYIVSGEELVNTPAGEFKTLKVERDRDDDNTRQTITWFAPDLDFMPVKLRQIEDGKVQADMLLKKIEM